MHTVNLPINTKSTNCYMCLQKEKGKSEWNKTQKKKYNEKVPVKMENSRHTIFLSTALPQHLLTWTQSRWILAATGRAPWRRVVAWWGSWRWHAWGGCPRMVACPPPSPAQWCLVEGNIIVGIMIKTCLHPFWATFLTLIIRSNS